MLRIGLLSPLAAVSRELSLARPAELILRARSLHASASALGGRYAQQVPDRERNWRARLSKKARRRHARRADFCLNPLQYDIFP